MVRLRKVLIGVLGLVLALGLFTSATGQNLVTNPGFQQGYAGDPGSGWLTVTDGIMAYWSMATGANKFQRLLNGAWNGTGTGAIVQVVPTTPGQKYGLEADFTFFWVVGTPSQPYETKIGYDLTGQTTDVNASTIVWKHWKKGRARIQFTATGANTSIWICLKTQWATAVYALDVDNVSVVAESGTDVVISNVQVATVGSSIKITWQTDVPATSRVNYIPTDNEGRSLPSVDTFDVDDPYAPPQFKYAGYVEDETLTTDHEVVIPVTELQPMTIYHFNVYSAGGPGTHPSWTDDMTFTTPGNPSAELVNGSFEQGRTGWTWVPCGDGGWKILDNNENSLVGPYPESGTEAWYGGIKAQEGSYFVGSVSRDQNPSATEKTAGAILQQLLTTPEEFYMANAWIRTGGAGPAYSPASGTPDERRVCLAFDPDGGINPNLQPNTGWDAMLPPTLVKSGWQYTESDEEPYEDQGWKQVSLLAQATGNISTLYVCMVHKNERPWNITAVDNVTCIAGVPQTNRGIDAARTLPAGQPVEITGIVVGRYISDDGQGGYYNDSFAVEAPDRSAGSRVVWNQNVEVGDEVTVKGVTGATRGERVIYPFSTGGVTINSSGNPTPEPFAIFSKDTGGGAYGAQPAVVDDATASPKIMSKAANNIGLLMKIRGIVTHKDVDTAPGAPFYHDFFYVDDCYTDEMLGIQTGLKDGSTYTGIKCRPPVGMFDMPGEMPEEGTYVEVTGVMGIREIDGVPARYMWTVSWEPASFQTYNGTRANKWNLLSLPGMPKNSDPAYVFAIPPMVPDPDLIDGRLYRWDGAAQGLVGYDMWAPDIFGAVSNVNGYWLKTSGAAPISYDGYAQSGLDWWIAVYNGWNIIGMPFTSSTIWDEWKATDGTAMKSIYEACQYPGSANWLQSIGYWWDAGVQGMVDFGLEDDFPTTNELTPWHGYWLKAKKNIGLVAPAPSM